MRLKAMVLACAALGMGFSTGAALACDKPATTVFSCLTGQGKRIQVCDAGNTIDYSFCRPGAKPEIVVRSQRADASTYQWRGMGRWMNYSVSVPNGNTVYRVHWGVDRLAEQHPIEAGVDVEISGKHAATVLCVGEKHIVQKMEGINLRRTD